MSKTFTTEQLVSRWEDHQEIVNLMGRRSFWNLWKMEDTVYDVLWCKKAPDPCMIFNDGAYKGYAAIEGYFQALHDLNVIRAKAVQAENPQKLGKKTEEALYGVGSCNIDNLTTPVVEVAADGRTAKGVWYALMEETDYQASGCTSYHCWGWVAADFIKEDGQWKLWHLIVTEDFKCLPGQNWSKEGNPEKPADPAYAKVAAFDFPAPNVPGVFYAHISKTRAPQTLIQLPVPYDTFSNTFSYGL